MVVRAKLISSQPIEPQTNWQGHKVNCSSLRASLLFNGARRMDAEHYLEKGFQIRSDIESKSSGWLRFKEIAEVWRPPRFKGIESTSEFGVPFFKAGQIYDMRPIPRKWLATRYMDTYAQLFVDEGTILVTCSGNIGRATCAYNTTKNILVSGDLLRVKAKPKLWGWVYACLRTPSVREMMNVSQYGHTVKHLDPHHLNELPLPKMEDPKMLKWFQEMTEKILTCRNEAFYKLKKAETFFEKQFSSLPKQDDASVFIRRASQTLFHNRRRFEAQNHNPKKENVEEHIDSFGPTWNTLEQAGCQIWSINRFKSISVEDGVELIGSAQIFELNPDYEKRISTSNIKDIDNAYVEPGWIMMARDGQVYGIIGSVVIATTQHKNKLPSCHVIRIIPSEDIPSGYLCIAIGHPTLGRPRIKSLPCGSSVPTIEIEDLKKFRIPRLDKRIENTIAEFAETAFELWAEADDIENQITHQAENMISNFFEKQT